MQIQKHQEQEVLFDSADKLQYSILPPYPSQTIRQILYRKLQFVIVLSNRERSDLDLRAAAINGIELKPHDYRVHLAVSLYVPTVNSRMSQPVIA